jgi:hypothetical protein
MTEMASPPQASFSVSDRPYRPLLGRYNDGGGDIIATYERPGRSGGLVRAGSGVRLEHSGGRGVGSELIKRGEGGKQRDQEPALQVRHRRRVGVLVESLHEIGARILQPRQDIGSALPLHFGPHPHQAR